MSDKNDKELYLNFDEYIRQGEPQKKERAEAWRVAIGLQAVDGLKVSGYLLELARRNIEGEITMEEVNKLLDEYYEEKHRIRDTWREYETYTKIDVHPDPEGSKRGRPIWYITSIFFVAEKLAAGNRIALYNDIKSGT